MAINRVEIYNITNGKCFYCGCELNIKSFHIDHFVARCKNGKQHKNLVPACPDCNLSKGGLPLEDFRKKLSSLLKNHQGRMIKKYYNVTSRSITFYFDEVQDGNIQKRVNDILDRQQSN
mgnify:FL=1